MKARIGAGKSSRIGWTALLMMVSLPAEGQIPDEFSNLTVLPKDIEQRRLVNIMRSFASSLGVRCIHCHVGESADSLAGFDFASDEKPAKNTARVMMRMTRKINNELLPEIGKESTRQVTCETCHRKLNKPETLNQVLATAVEKDGAEGAVEEYRALREEYYSEGVYDFGPAPLNRAAEILAWRRDDVEGAITVMELNVEVNPGIANSHLLLGRLHLQKGDREAAAAAFERALELEPDNRWAKSQLEAAHAAPEQ